MFQLKILQKKLESHQKKYKFVTNKTEICLFCYSFIFFMKLRLNFQMMFFFLVLSFQKTSWIRLKNDTTQKKMKKSHIGNMSQSYSQFWGFCFFQWLTHLKKAYVMMIYKFLIGYHALQSVICKYNYLHHKNLGLKYK